MRTPRIQSTGFEAAVGGLNYELAAALNRIRDQLQSAFGRFPPKADVLCSVRRRLLIPSRQNVLYAHRRFFGR
jgi:hypothetical protein